MEKKLTEQEAKNLVEQIVDYMFREGAIQNLSDDEKMQVPANFIYHEYPRAKEKNHWSPAVFYGQDGNGRDYSVINKNPELAATLGNLSYHDFLELQKALVETGIFRPDPIDYRHPNERADFDEIAHSVRIYTTFGEIKNYSFDKPKSL